MKSFLRGIAVLMMMLMGAGWWFLVAGSDAASTAPTLLFPISEWRAEIAEDEVALRPTGVRLIEVGSDVAPKIGAQAGSIGPSWNTTYGGFEIVTPAGSIFVDSGIDAETAEIMARSPETAVFNQAEYDALSMGSQMLNIFCSPMRTVIT